MRNSRYIVSIDQTSGLPPAVINMINSNFWNLLDMFEDPEIVMVAGVNAPDPRTNETIWYKTDTGALNIWSKQDDDSWGWTTLATIIDDVISVSDSVDYNRLQHKPSITEVDLGIRQNGTFGPLGTTTTVVIQGDDSYDGRLMKVLSNSEIQAIIDAADASS